MEDLFLEIYASKKIKYCVGCLHTDDVTKLYAMQNYTWVFSTLFTNLYLTDELHCSWICSWCIQRLNNAKHLLKNFKQAQILLSKIAEDPCKTVKDDICNEINKLKLNTRLNFSCILDKSIDNIESYSEIKSELSDCNISYEEDNIDNELDLRNPDLPYESSNEEVTQENIDFNLKTNRSKQSTVTSKLSTHNIIRKSKRKKQHKETRCTLKNESVDLEIIYNTQNETHLGEKDSNYIKKESNLKDQLYITKDSLPLDSITKLSHISGFTSDTNKIIAKTKLVGKTAKPEICNVLIPNHSFKKGKRNKRIRPYLPHIPRIQCSECDCLFIKDIALLNHLKRKHKKKYPCEQCDRIYPKEEHLKTHVAKVHEVNTGIFECAVCGRVFKHRLSIVKHMMRHEKYGKSLKEIERIVCDHCGKICNRRNIKSHLVKHSNVKEHHCSLCSASFKVASTLENHVKRKHKDPSLEKIFACEQCGRKFYDSTQVKYHMISIHAFEGHACPVCSKCFPTQGKVREHVLRVHENVRPVRDKQCDFCEKVFSTKRMLRHHHYTHTGEKPYKCDLCTSAYNQSHCLKKHKIRAHNTER